MATENDIVLVYMEDAPIFFARIEDISADIKKNWYHVKLLVLQVPVYVITWILRDVYINGETFTMNGKRIRLEKIICPAEPKPEQDEIDAEMPDKTSAPENSPQKNKIISLADRKK